MKKISCLKLAQISASDLLARQMNLLRGGGTCTCTCTCNCSCPCPCTSYPNGGISNSSTTANSFNNMFLNSEKEGTMTTMKDFDANKPGGYYDY